MTGSSVRTPGASARLLFGDCEISLHTHELRRQGQTQKIRRKAFDVLLLLIDQRPRTLSHEFIAREIWGRKTHSGQWVARAVMEARREIGDDPESPRCIVSVRGVGYRFAAEVTLAEVDVQMEPEGQGARAARADTEAAAACVRRGQLDEARRLVDRAIATADLAGARPELARALALAASVLLCVGSREHASTLATKAMRLAQLEGRADVLADAQIGLAEVHLWMGSAHAALDQLLAVHRALSGQGPGFALWRCERLLADTHRELARPQEAWSWWERALASALHFEPETRAVRERLSMVGVLHTLMEEADAEDRAEDVRTNGLRALELLDAIESDARALGMPSFELVSQTYRGVTLEIMGEVAEGWAVIEKLRPVLFDAKRAWTPWLEFRRKEVLQVEAGLLSRSGRGVEAMRAIEYAILSTKDVVDLPNEPASLHRMAARICERAGQYKEALRWQRLQLKSVAKLHSDRAQATAEIVRVQLESDRLSEDLAQARAEVDRLTRHNLELERRIVQMDRHPMLDDGGLVPAAALAAAIDGRAALARERELPMCIGIVELVGLPDDSGVEADLLVRRRRKLLASTLKALMPEASLAAQWRPGVYFFIIADMGLGPARQRCQALAQRLNAEVVPNSTPQPDLGFRADAVDVTRFSGIEVALSQVAGAYPQPV